MGILDDAAKLGRAGLPGGPVKAPASPAQTAKSLTELGAELRDAAELAASGGAWAAQKMAAPVTAARKRAGWEAVAEAVAVLALLLLAIGKDRRR
jgi:hypothetical protein